MVQANEKQDRQPVVVWPCHILVADDAKPGEAQGDRGIAMPTHACGAPHCWLGQVEEKGFPANCGLSCSAGRSPSFAPEATKRRWPETCCFLALWHCLTLKGCDQKNLKLVLCLSVALSVSCLSLFLALWHAVTTAFPSCLRSRTRRISSNCPSPEKPPIKSHVCSTPEQWPKPWLRDDNYPAYGAYTTPYFWAWCNLLYNQPSFQSHWCMQLRCQLDWQSLPKLIGHPLWLAGHPSW